MHNLERSTITYITFSFALFSVVALLYVFVYRHIQFVANDAVDLVLELGARESGKERDKSIAEYAEQVAPYTTLFETYTVTLEDPTELLGIIESIGTATGAEVLVQSIATESRGTDVVEKVMQLTLGVTGTWGEVYHALHMVENVPYFVSIDNIVFVGGDTWSGTMSCSFRAV